MVASATQDKGLQERLSCTGDNGLHKKKNSNIQREAFIFFEVSFFLKFILIENERASEHGEGRGWREADREKRERIPSRLCALTAQSLMQGSISQTVRSRPDPKSRVRHFTE